MFPLQERDPAALNAQADLDAELALQTAAALRTAANPRAVEGYVPRQKRLPSNAAQRPVPAKEGTQKGPDADC
jgi:hypothetical protein